MFKTLFIALSLALATPSVDLFSPAIEKHVTAFLEEYLVENFDTSLADKLVKTQKEDGTWAKVDYNNKLRGAWKTADHMDNYMVLACSYYKTKDARYLDAARKALKFWYTNMPTCPNWWYNEIGIPKLVGPSTVLIMKDLSEDDLKGAAKILKRAKFGRKTGQNLLWVATNTLIRAYIEKDTALLMECRNAIQSVISVEAWAEGIQPDWSFHQHGPQLQWGNYGAGYIKSMSWLAKLFDNTPLAFSPDQRKILEDYARYGVTQPVWKGYFDMNCCGRQINEGSQRSKAKSILENARRLGVEPEQYTGGRYFPYVDFGIYKTADWYASVRMESNRTIGMEQTNKENMRGRFAADGALLVRRDGDEYFDVAAAWNWHHVPGVTCHDDGNEIFGWEIPEDKRYNKSGNVSGKVEGEYMTCWMELDRDGLNAKKAWFFSPEGIVCLGAGISMTGIEKVVTGVEQCVIKGEIEKNSKYISHNGVTYISLDGKFITAPKEHSGDWGTIHPARKGKKSEINLLEFYYDHGTNPSNAKYAYIVVPNGEKGSQAYKRAKKVIKVIENSPKRQSISINGKILSVEW